MEIKHAEKPDYLINDLFNQQIGTLDMIASVEISEESITETPPQFEFGYFADFFRSSDIPTLRAHINDIIRDLNFSDFLYTRLDNPGTPQLLLNTLPEELLSSYCENQYFKHDMRVAHAKNNSQPFFSSTIHDYLADAPFSSDMTSCMDGILQLNRSFGYYDYYNIPILGKGCSTQALLSVTQRGMSPVDLKNTVRGGESTLHLLSEAIEAVVARKFSREIVGINHGKYSQLKLTPKPLRVLSTLANNDYNINEVAEKLSISVVTVNQHLKTVRNKLGTKTNYAAIKQAILSNLIQFSHQPNCVDNVHDK
jgi:DNA-binding CsgD family transcriptional regulator